MSKISPKLLLAEFRERFRYFYPFFLGFYLFSVFVALFSKTWSDFFYWPAFHGFAILFTVLTGMIGSEPKLSRKFLKMASVKLIDIFSFTVDKLGRVSLKTWLKLFIIAFVLIIGTFKSIGALEFLILSYALVSFLFVFNSRYAAGAALVLLTACPLLLLFHKDVLAQKAAIYAYYFLVIAILTQARRLGVQEQEKN